MCDSSDVKMELEDRGEGTLGKQSGLPEDNLFIQSVLIDNQAIKQRCLLKRLDCASVIVNTIIFMSTPHAQHTVKLR